jgi:hypothetical protein
MQEQQKPSRGRPVGTKSYAAVGVSELSAMATEGFIPISKKYLKSIGADISKYSDFEVNSEQKNEPEVKTVNLAKVVKPKAVKAPKVKAKKEEAPEEQIDFVIQD